MHKLLLIFSSDISLNTKKTGDRTEFNSPKKTSKSNKAYQITIKSYKDFLHIFLFALRDRHTEEQLSRVLTTIEENLLTECMK